MLVWFVRLPSGVVSVSGSVIEIAMTSLSFHVLVDPRQNQIGNLQVVLVLHEHVAVAVQLIMFHGVPADRGLCRGETWTEDSQPPHC